MSRINGEKFPWIIIGPSVSQSDSGGAAAYFRHGRMPVPKIASRRRAVCAAGRIGRRHRGHVLAAQNILKKSNYEDVWKKTKCYTIPEIKNLPFSLSQLTYTELAEYVKDCIREDFE